MKRAAFDPEWLATRLAELLPAFPDVALCVALSGGADSVALLAALAGGGRKSGQKRARLKSSPQLRAIHIHHGLHPNADQWSDHCARLAARLGVPLTVVRVKVAAGSGVSLEAAARQARYEAFARALKPGEVLLTAHHQDDQLETVFLQLLRGAGVPGLAAMPDIAEFPPGWLARPLLTRSRAELTEWVSANHFTWVDDDTNANEQFDRNYLRRVVLPLVRERWPSAAAAVSRSARHAGEARRLLDALALADVERASVGASLAVQQLRALGRDRRRNALRFWITRRGFTAPDTRRLDELSGPLLDARADSTPRMEWNGVVVERHADLLSIRSPGSRGAGFQSGEQVWSWREQPRFELSAPRGVLSIEPDRHGPLDLDTLPDRLAVRGRRGGEKLRPNAASRTRTLKALLQEARISPAQRERLPLVFARDQLIAVGGRWLDASVQAKPTARRRGRILWRPE